MINPYSAQWALECATNFYNSVNAEAPMRVAWGVSPRLDPEAFQGALLQYRETDFELVIGSRGRICTLALYLKPPLKIAPHQYRIIANIGRTCIAIPSCEEGAVQSLRYAPLFIEGLHWCALPQAADRLLEARDWLAENLQA